MCKKNHKKGEPKAFFNLLQDKKNGATLNWNVSSNIWDRRAWDPALFWHLWTADWGHVLTGSISSFSEGEDVAAGSSSVAAGNDSMPYPSTPGLRRVDCKFTNRKLFRVCHKASFVVHSCVSTCRLYCFSDLQTEKQQRWTWLSTCNMYVLKMITEKKWPITDCILVSNAHFSQSSPLTLC